MLYPFKASEILHKLVCDPIILLASVVEAYVKKLESIHTFDWRSSKLWWDSPTCTNGQTIKPDHFPYIFASNQIIVEQR